MNKVERDVTTFETAILLHKKGFPQPQISYGQIWYFIETQEALTATVVSDDAIKMDDNTGHYTLLEEKDKWVYAPDVSDLLRELPEGYYIKKKVQFDESMIFQVFTSGYRHDKGYEAPQEIVRDKNPAEALAKTWLYMDVFN